MTQKDIDTFTWIIQVHLALYFEKGIEELQNPEKQNNIIFRIKAAASSYAKLHPQNQTTIEDIKQKTSKEFEKTMSKHISFIIFALELARFYVELVPKKYRHNMNISPKKLKLGHRVYTKYMLIYKQLEPEDYKDKRETIDDSSELALFFIKYWMDIYNIPCEPEQ